MILAPAAETDDCGVEHLYSSPTMVRQTQLRIGRQLNDQCVTVVVSGSKKLLGLDPGILDDFRVTRSLALDKRCKLLRRAGDRFDAGAGKTLFQIRRGKRLVELRIQARDN